MNAIRILDILKHVFLTQNKPPTLGRWNIHNHRETILKIKYANEDNCSSSYHNHKNTPKNKELVDFLINGNNYQDEELPNFNFGRERLPPPPPPKPPQQEFKDPSEFSEYPEEDDDYQEPSSQPSLISDVPANKTYSKWTLSQLQQETINRGLYTITNEPKQGQSRNAYGNRDKTRKELISGLHEYDRIKLNKNN